MITKGQPGEEVLSLDKLRSEQKSLNLDPASIRQLFDSRLKQFIILGFFLCSFTSLLAGGVKLLSSSHQDSEREAIGLMTNIMSGITGIAAGVFTGGALR